MSISSSFGGHVVALLYSCKPARGGGIKCQLWVGLCCHRQTNTVHRAWLDSMARFPVGAACGRRPTWHWAHLSGVTKHYFEASENWKTFLQLLQGIWKYCNSIGFVTEVMEYANDTRISVRFFFNICSTIPAPGKNAGESGAWVHGWDRFFHENQGIHITEGFRRASMIDFRGPP